MWIQFPLWATLQRNIPRDHLQSYPISVCASWSVKVFSWCLADCYGVSGRLGDMVRMALVTWQGDDDDSGKLPSLIQFSIWLTDDGRGRRIVIDEGIGIGKWCVDTIPTVEYLSINGWNGECNSTFIWMATYHVSLFQHFDFLTWTLQQYCMISELKAMCNDTGKPLDDIIEREEELRWCDARQTKNSRQKPICHNP
jgi:hypothetical protein